MTVKIRTLEELTVRDIDRVTDLFMDAFHDYPKLKLAFPQMENRLTALEATLRFYIAYDMKFGKCYSLDKMVNEAILIVESDQIKYNFFRYLIAGSYSRKYINAMKRLGKEGRQNRIKLFEELDAMERKLDIPRPHLYLDFLGVRTTLQGLGRGRRLMGHICNYADERKLPLMLFTNTEKDVEFYKSFGFDIIGETHSQRFGFTNWYMVRNAILS
jgi:ribosomal protein S18 acetylase RimI-like enzyme